MNREPFVHPWVEEPVRCCSDCGEEFKNGGHMHARDAGWRGFSNPTWVTQANGLKRREYVGKCPACVAAEAEGGAQTCGGD